MFKSGKSGNPAGRPVGCGKVHKYRKLLHSQAPLLIQKLIDLALAGDTTALKLCLDRIFPPLRPGDYGGFVAVGEPADQMQQVQVATLAGEVTPPQARVWLQLLAYQDVTGGKLTMEQARELLRAEWGGDPEPLVESPGDPPSWSSPGASKTAPLLEPEGDEDA